MNKKILRTLTALCAALMLTGGFSVTAFAQTPEGEDDTNDSGVVYEEPQKEEPLTPDGNATLVDDFGGNKQLITVTTKNGNYFYILIDRDDEVDMLFNQVKTDVIALLKSAPDQADQGIDLLMVAKYLERIGDHAVNVCEWTQFSKTGTLKNVRIM